MASLFPTSAHHSNTQYNNNWVYPIWKTSIPFLSSHLVFFPCSINHNSSPIHLHRSFSGYSSNLNRTILRASPGPPPSPPGQEPQRSIGIAATFSKLWDTLQIFVAVLFWMSLFFWASASDGKNSGRSNKSDRFRK